jgi:hypothetical protein
MIEVVPKIDIRSEYDKIRKDSEFKLKKMFALNPSRAKLFPVLIILLFS